MTLGSLVKANNLTVTSLILPGRQLNVPPVTRPIPAGVGDPALIAHVGIALDSRRWVHAVGSGRTVSVTALPATDRIMAVQRIALP